MALVALAVLLLGLFAYGGWKRRQRQYAALTDTNLPKSVAPATAAAADIEKDVPSGNALTPRPQGILASAINAGELRAPEDLARLNTVYQQPVPIQSVYVTSQGQQIHQPTPEEQRLQNAYEAEQRAMAAPTSLRDGFGGTNTNSSGQTEPLQLASALQPLSPNRSAVTPKASGEAGTTSNETFLKRDRTGIGDDYLKSTRTAALSPYEIKAGWEIPAVMEQALNSDLPGEVKALVTSNVFDTATGQYILIPQGARLVGEYNSNVNYGQAGVQVVWNRVIYPDGSSLNLNGMNGEDAHGFSGFRDQVDHHYKRLIGFAVLSSLFAAASEISQSQDRSVLTYPTPAETAGSAVGQQVSDLGAQITRKNLNVQPTIKIPVGYRFDVRVNRDIMFDSPYKPFS